MYDWHFEPDAADIAASNGYEWRRSPQDRELSNLARKALDERMSQNWNHYGNTGRE